MRPDNDSEIKEIDSNIFRLGDNDDISNINQKIRTPAQTIENNRFISLFLAISLLFFIGLIFYKNGFSLDLNIVSWSFSRA